MREQPGYYLYFEIRSIPWSPMKWWEGKPLIWSPHSHSGLKAAQGGQKLQSISCSFVKWWKLHGSKRQFQRSGGDREAGRQAWNLVLPFPLKFSPQQEIQNALLVWSALLSYSNGLPAPLVLEPTLCPEVASLMMLQCLPQICKTPVHCLRMGLMTSQLQHKLNTEEVFENMPQWKNYSGN